jgi:hypothetical protein
LTYILLTQQAFAQSCDDLIYFKPSKEYIYEITLKANGKSVKSSYKTTAVYQSGKWKTAEVNGIFELQGSYAATFTGKVMCDGALLRLDAKMFSGNADSDFSDSYIEYPMSMKTGQALKDGKLKINFKGENNKEAIMVIDILDRKVSGREKIQTNAGAYDCFVISSTHDSGFLQEGQKKNSTKTQQKEWFAPGYGIIQAESSQSVIKLTSVSQ